MPTVIDHKGIAVFFGRSDAECCRWWTYEGEMTDRFEDTGELVADVAAQLDLD